MSLLKKTLAAFSLIVAFSIFAQAEEIELKGRLVKHNGNVHLQYKEGKKTKYTLVHGDFNIFLGQDVWLAGRLDHANNFLYTSELVTERNSLIKGQVGRGVMIIGSLAPNGFEGLNFVVQNSKTNEKLGGLQSLRVIWPDEHYLSKSKDYIHKAILKGVVSGNNFYVSDDTYATHIVAHRASVEAGDVVVVTGVLFDADSSDDYDFRNHFNSNNPGLTYGSGNAYGIGQSEESYVIVDPFDVFIKDKQTGKLVPAELDGDLYASFGDDRLYDLTADPIRMTFVGEMTSKKHILLSDATAVASTERPPQLEERAEPPVQAQPEQTPVRKGHLEIVSSNRNPTPCADSLSEEKPRPKLYIVPKVE